MPARRNASIIGQGAAGFAVVAAVGFPQCVEFGE